jgi:hypothetical protein
MKQVDVPQIRVRRFVTATAFVTALLFSLVACVSVPPVSFVLVPSENLSVIEGGSVTVTVNAVPNTVTPQVAWQSSDEDVATVTSTGANSARVDGLQAGSVTITATVAGAAALTASVTVTPTPAAVGAVIVDAPESLVVGESYQLAGVIETVGGLEDVGSWISVTPSVLTVNASGVVTAVAAGVGVLTFGSVSNPDLVDSVVVTVFASVEFDVPSPGAVMNPLGGVAPTVVFGDDSFSVTTAGVTTSVAFFGEDDGALPVGDSLVVPRGGSISFTVPNARFGSVIRVLVGSETSFVPVVDDVTNVVVRVPAGVGALDAGVDASFARVDFVTGDVAGAFAFGFFVPEGSASPVVFDITVVWPQTPLFVGVGYEPDVMVVGWLLPDPVEFTVGSSSSNVTVVGNVVTGSATGEAVVFVEAYGVMRSFPVLFVNPPAAQAPGFVSAVVSGSEIVTVSWEDVGVVELQRSRNVGVWVSVFEGSGGVWVDEGVVAGDSVRYRVRGVSGVVSEFVVSDAVLVLGAAVGAVVVDAVVDGGVLSFGLLVEDLVERPVSSVSVDALVVVGGVEVSYSGVGLVHSLPGVLVEGAEVSVFVTVEHAFGSVGSAWDFVVPVLPPAVVDLVVVGGVVADAVSVSWVPEVGWSVRLTPSVGGVRGVERVVESSLGSDSFVGLVAGSSVSVFGRHEGSVLLAGVPVSLVGVEVVTGEPAVVVGVPSGIVGLEVELDDVFGYLLSWDNDISYVGEVTMVVAQRAFWDGPPGLGVEGLDACEDVPLGGVCTVSLVVLGYNWVLVSGVEFSLSSTFSSSVNAWSLPAGCSGIQQGTKVVVDCGANPSNILRFSNVSLTRVTEGNELPEFVNAKYTSSIGADVFEYPIPVTDLGNFDFWVTFSTVSGNVVPSTAQTLGPPPGFAVEFRVKQGNSVGESDWVLSDRLPLPN